MDQQQLQQVEILCQKLYQSALAEERREAENALTSFSSSPSFIPFAQFILDRSMSTYARMFAAYSLTSIINKQFTVLEIKDRVELRNYLLTYLGSHANVEPYILSSLAQLLCRITKLGWFDSDDLKNTYEEVTKFLKASTDYVIIGLLILSQLVNEMNQPQSPRNVAKHRKLLFLLEICN